jgi:glutaredoxin
MTRKKKNTGMIVATIVIILAALIAYQAYRATIEDPFHTRIAQCLTQNGVAMYGEDTCPFCNQQKRVFGELTFRRHITYVECDKDPQACRDANVESYPTWIYGDERINGLRQLGELAEFGGCTDVLED